MQVLRSNEKIQGKHNVLMLLLYIYIFFKPNIDLYHLKDILFLSPISEKCLRDNKGKLRKTGCELVQEC